MVIKMSNVRIAPLTDDGVIGTMIKKLNNKYNSNYDGGVVIWPNGNTWVIHPNKHPPGIFLDTLVNLNSLPEYVIDIIKNQGLLFYAKQQETKIKKCLESNGLEVEILKY